MISMAGAVSGWSNAASSDSATPSGSMTQIRIRAAPNRSTMGPVASAETTEATARPANQPANHSSDQPLAPTRWTWWKMIPVPTNDGSITAGNSR